MHLLSVAVHPVHAYAVCVLIITIIIIVIILLYNHYPMSVALTSGLQVRNNAVFGDLMCDIRNKLIGIRCTKLMNIYM